MHPSIAPGTISNRHCYQLRPLRPRRPSFWHCSKGNKTLPMCVCVPHTLGADRSQTGPTGPRPRLSLRNAPAFRLLISYHHLDVIIHASVTKLRIFSIQNITIINHTITIHALPIRDLAHLDNLLANSNRTSISSSSYITIFIILLPPKQTCTLRDACPRKPSQASRSICLLS